MKKKIEIVTATALALSMLSGCENAVTDGNTNVEDSKPGQKVTETDVNDLENDMDVDGIIPDDVNGSEDNTELDGVIPDDELVLMGEVPAPEEDFQEVSIIGDFPIDDDDFVITDRITGEDAEEEAELAGRMLPEDGE